MSLSMNATRESVIDAAMMLDAADRCEVAAWLWESVGAPIPERSADELESLLDHREAEMEGDTSLEISHQDFIGHFAKRRFS